MAAEQAKKEAAEKELELMRQQQSEQEQAKEAQMRTLSENMAQLQKKMESERGNLLREQERVLDHKIKVRIDGDGSAWETMAPQEGKVCQGNHDPRENFPRAHDHEKVKFT